MKVYRVKFSDGTGVRVKATSYTLSDNWFKFFFKEEGVMLPVYIVDASRVFYISLIERNGGKTDGLVITDNKA